jgi:hypothetical protein
MLMIEWRNAWLLPPSGLFGFSDPVLIIARGASALEYAGRLSASLITTPSRFCPSKIMPERQPKLNDVSIRSLLSSVLEIR